MCTPVVHFPLSLRPVVRSRERGAADGASLQYHAAIWIVDGTGRRVTDIAPDPNDLRGGRATHDPHGLVARASRTVDWLQRLHDRLSAWTASLESPPDLVVRPIVALEPGGSHVEAGVQFCAAPDDEFDRLTVRLEMLAPERVLPHLLGPLQDRIIKRHDAAVDILRTLQEAIESWRATEALTATDRPPLTIDDRALEH
jgi:hypothetical protein